MANTTDPKITELEFRGALPSEVEEPVDSDMPRELRSVGDAAEPLSAREASVAGMGRDAQTVYGESDEDPNRDDQADAHRA